MGSRFRLCNITIVHAEPSAAPASAVAFSVLALGSTTDAANGEHPTFRTRSRRYDDLSALATRCEDHFRTRHAMPRFI